jgi:hypothetical protein
MKRGFLVAALLVGSAATSFARSRHSSSGDDPGKLIPFAIVAVIGLIAVAVNATRKPKSISPEQIAELQTEATHFFNRIEAGNFTPPSTPLMLSTEESALLNEPSTLLEARASRVYAGGGTRVHGIYVGGGQSTSVQRLKELDAGTLTLTTKRLVFTGSMESRVVKFKDIVSVQAMGDAIELSIANRAKRQVYLVHNPILWGALLRSFLSNSQGTVAAKSASLIHEQPQSHPEKIHSDREPSSEDWQTSQQATHRVERANSIPSGVTTDTNSSRRLLRWPVALSVTGLVVACVVIGFGLIVRSRDTANPIDPEILSKDNTLPGVSSPSAPTAALSPVPPASNAPPTARTTIESDPGFVILTAPVTLFNAHGKEVKRLPIGKKLRVIHRNATELVIDYVGERYTIPAASTTPLH